VIIVGASVRAAAFSALRAGLRPICVDQFADADLQKAAPTVRVTDYPAALPRVIASLPPAPVIYTGAMENHPAQLAEIAAHRTLLGNDVDVLKGVRDPFEVHEVLRRFKVPRLRVRSESNPPPADGQWLLKPRHGSAGRGICVWDDAALDSPTLSKPHYFQQRGDGETVSAVFLATQDPFHLRYVGLTRQLVGLRELNARPFAWCGSIGPVVLDVAGEILVRRTGSVLAHHFGLKGLFGCDFIVPARDRPLLTEVNPRYTASVEVVEILGGFNLIRDHCAATGLEVPETLPQSILSAPSRATVGKVVLYAERDAIAPDTSAWRCMTPLGPIPALADVPERGSRVKRGSPVCTVLAAAATEADCYRYLLREALEVAQRLSGGAISPAPVEN
jgi:predicted ATP-grasp superfamily ATP-dependent carboligase